MRRVFATLAARTHLNIYLGSVFRPLRLSSTTLDIRYSLGSIERDSELGAPRRHHVS